MPSTLVHPDPATEVPPDAGAAVALAPMVEVWFRILVEHVPDPDGHCRSCTSAGTGARNTPWPCAVRTVAAMARERHAALSAPATRSEPTLVPQRRARERRILHGEHGSACPMTPRERMFLQMAVDGRGDAEIAERLDVPEHTVSITIRRITRKLGVGDRSALLVLALRAGFVV